MMRTQPPKHKEGAPDLPLRVTLMTVGWIGTGLLVFGVGANLLEKMAGGVLVSIGGIVAGSEVYRRKQAEVARQQNLREQARRQAKTQERQTRRREQGEKRQVARRLRIQAEQQRRKREAEVREQEHQAEAEAARLRKRRAEAVEMEAEQLRQLTFSQLDLVVRTILAQNGGHLTRKPVPAIDFAMCLQQDTKTMVISVLPNGQTAETGDLDAIEAFRQAESAEAALLVALTGFAPEAVRRSGDLPITLVDAHLLALWKLREPITLSFPPGPLSSHEAE